MCGLVFEYTFNRRRSVSYARLTEEDLYVLRIFFSLLGREPVSGLRLDAEQASSPVSKISATGMSRSQSASHFLSRLALPRPVFRGRTWPEFNIRRLRRIGQRKTSVVQRVAASAVRRCCAVRSSSQQPVDSCNFSRVFLIWFPR